MVTFQLLKLAFHRLAILVMVGLSVIVTSTVSFADEDTSIVVLFGDSISLGWNFAYVAEHGQDRRGNARVLHGQPSIQLSSLLNDNLRKSLVLNDGWGGTASGEEGEDSEVFSANNGVYRITSDLIQIKSIYPESEYKDYYVLIMYGTNDAAYGIGPSTTGFNIQIIINAAKAQGYTPVVGTIPPCNGCGFNPSLVNYYVEDAVNKTQSNSSPVYFADHYSKLAPSWNSLNDDGVHPNDAGYQIIAQNWFDSVLAGIIEPRRSSTVAPIFIPLLLDD